MPNASLPCFQQLPRALLPLKSLSLISAARGSLAVFLHMQMPLPPLSSPQPILFWDSLTSSDSGSGGGENELETGNLSCPGASQGPDLTPFRAVEGLPLLMDSDPGVFGLVGDAWPG